MAAAALWGYPAWSGLGGLLAHSDIHVAVRRLACGRATHRDGDVLGHLRGGLRHLPRPAEVEAGGRAGARSRAGPVTVFFGQSFRVLTDNPSWLLVVAALERLLAYVREPRTSRLVAFTALAATATLMRQVAARLFLPATVGVLTSGLPARKLVRDASILALGLLPLLALLVAWGGLLPREIGISPAHLPHHPLQYLLLSLAVLGFYGVLLCLWTSSGRSRGALGTEAASSLERRGHRAGRLGSWRPQQRRRKRPLCSGLASFAGRLYPGPCHTSILLWAFAPVGAATAAIIGCTCLRTQVDRVLGLSLAGAAPDDRCSALLVPALCRLPDPSTSLHA